MSDDLNAVITEIEPGEALPGPLHGKRLLVKDLIDTAGLVTTYGSAIYRDHVPERSAPCVTTLEAAGYAVVGKTNLHEFAYGITSDNVAEQAETSQIPDVQRLLGVEPEPVEQLGLEPTAIYTAVEQVGNYGEIYNRNLGPDTQFNIPRGLNAQWSDGGLIYGIPFR